MIRSIRKIRLLMLALAVMLATLAPRHAQAATPSFVKTTKGSAVSLATISAKEKKAYKMAYKACLRYESEPSSIVVDVGKLGLTTKQARHVQYLLHSNGELFWIDTYNDANFTAKKFILRCTYDDKTITKMRKKLDKAVNKAMKRITSEMDPATKILTLHDYLIDHIDYVEHKKTAYTGLVQGQADCMGCALTMDLLLRRAGFTTDMAYSTTSDHAWNLVKVKGKWYHIDLTWDRGFTVDSARGYWDCLGESGRKGRHCHLFLLQTDKRIKSDVYRGYSGFSHGKWWAHSTCTSTTYSKEVKLNSTVFAENKYKLYVSGFTVGGLRYKLCGTGKAMLVGVKTTAKKRAATLSVPATITYKKVTYKVVGISGSAFAKAKAKTLVIATPSLTKARVKGCLIGSKVKTIRLTGTAVRKKSTYKKAFTKKNTGAKATPKIA